MSLFLPKVHFSEQLFLVDRLEGTYVGTGYYCRVRKFSILDFLTAYNHKMYNKVLSKYPMLYTDVELWKELKFL